METQVRQFHEKFGYPIDKELAQETAEGRPVIQQILQRTEQNISCEGRSTLRAACESQPQDNRLYRAHLMLEELGEAIAAMVKGDKYALADALGDLLYVVIGTMITYKIPVDPTFYAIHMSNMTKQRTDTRMKNKGDDFVPPDLKGVLDAGTESVQKRSSSAEDKRGEDCHQGG